MTDRNDTYLFEDAQAVFGGDIPTLGLTAQLLVCVMVVVIVSRHNVLIRSLRIVVLDRWVLP